MRHLFDLSRLVFPQMLRLSYNFTANLNDARKTDMLLLLSGNLD